MMVLGDLMPASRDRIPAAALYWCSGRNTTHYAMATASPFTGASSMAANNVTADYP